MTLKITIQDEAQAVRLKIEGRVAGALVPELRRAWGQLAPSLRSRKLSVDLCGVTHVDAEGRRVLSEIHNETSADFLADTPLTKFFAEQATQGVPTKGR